MNIIVCPAPPPIKLYSSAHGGATRCTTVATGKFLLENNSFNGILNMKAIGPKLINVDDIPDKISTTFHQDYDISYIDDIIRRKLRHEQQVEITTLTRNLEFLTNKCMKPQTVIDRLETVNAIKKLQKEIDDIRTGDKLRRYESEVEAILSEYRKLQGKVKSIVFSNDDFSSHGKLDDDIRRRINCVEKYLEIASKYHKLDIIRVTEPNKNTCVCGTSLVGVASSDNGTTVCPTCFIEYNTVIRGKQSKDGARISNAPSAEDESIENFLRAFMRYQGLQCDRPDSSLYDELDEYFISNGRPSGDQIAELPLTQRGRRGDTDHKMLWNALSNIGRSEYYEDANLIGHIYWGWTLPDVMHLRENIIDKYNKTQAVFYQIPPAERGRNSSLGTQYRLWRHLQLEGHECYMDEFKIAENPESLRTHNKLWRMMCEGTQDPNIKYID